MKHWQENAENNADIHDVSPWLYNIKLELMNRYHMDYNEAMVLINDCYRGIYTHKDQLVSDITNQLIFDDRANRQAAPINIQEYREQALDYIDDNLFLVSLAEYIFIFERPRWLNH